MRLIKFLRIAAIAWLATVTCIPSAQADDWQLPQLMQIMAQHKTGKATFVEKKYIGIIDQPVVSTGALSFVAPDKLEKRTLTPRPEALLLNGDILTIDRAGKHRMVVSIEEYPEVAAFIESIRGTLAGDLSALQKLYTLQLTGSAEKWQLVLTPREERMSSIFSRIRISGSHAYVQTIGLDQRDGDHSEMFITQVSDQ